MVEQGRVGQGVGGLVNTRYCNAPSGSCAGLLAAFLSMRPTCARQRC